MHAPSVLRSGLTLTALCASLFCLAQTPVRYRLVVDGLEDPAAAKFASSVLADLSLGTQGHAFVDGTELIIDTQHSLDLQALQQRLSDERLRITAAYRFNAAIDAEELIPLDTAIHNPPAQLSTPQPE